MYDYFQVDTLKDSTPHTWEAVSEQDNCGGTGLITKEIWDAIFPAE